MADIDHFKRINDEHGHPVGDAVLRDVAYAMRSELRAFDLIYRLGGEEFAILLPGADLAKTPRDRRAAAGRGRAVGHRRRVGDHELRGGCGVWERRAARSVVCAGGCGAVRGEARGAEPRGLRRAGSLENQLSDH